MICRSKVKLLHDHLSAQNYAVYGHSTTGVHQSKFNHFYSKQAISSVYASGCPCKHMYNTMAHDLLLLFLVRLGQVQNGSLCVKYRSSSTKTKVEECKKFTENIIFLLYCEIYSINSVNLSQG